MQKSYVDIKLSVTMKLGCGDVTGPISWTIAYPLSFVEECWCALGRMLL